MNLCRFDSFLLGHAGHDGADALSDHAFPRTWGTDHENVMSTCHGDFDGVLGISLPLHIGKVDVVVGRCCEKLRRSAGFWSDIDVAFQILHDFP